MPRILFLLILLGVSAAAQQQPDPDGPLVRVTVNLVQVDAVVTDKSGTVITDLKPADFEILQDGSPRKITRFAFVPATSAPAPQPSAAPVPPPPFKPEQVRRTIVLVVDDLALSFESIVNVREAIKRFTTTLQSGDLVALMRTSAGSGAFQTFTSDRERIRALADTLRWYPRSRTGVNSNRPVGTNEADTVSRRTDQTRDSDAAEEVMLNRSAGLGTTGALQWVIQGLGPVPGRKSIVLFSEGFKMQDRVGGVDNANASLTNPLLRITAQATRAGVVIYTIDPRGVMPGFGTAADHFRDPRQFETVTDRRATEQTQTQMPLRVLAANTGGRAFIYTNTVDEGLRRMMADQAGFYLLGYDPASETFDRRYHKITVKVKRKGAEVRTRNGFVGVDDRAVQAPSGHPLLQALHAPFQASAIPLKLTGLFAVDPQRNPLLHCLLHVGLAGVQFAPAPDGRLRAELEVLVAGYNDAGETAHETLQSVTLMLDPAKREETLARGMSIAVAYPLKKHGPLQLRTAVRDLASGATGSASQFVLAPDLGNGKLALSGLVVASAREGNDRLRLASRQFQPGDEVAYSVQVLNAGAAAKLSMQVRLYAEGKSLFETPEKALASPEAANGVIRLSKDIAPGEYALQLIVTDRTTSKVRHLAQWTDLHVQ